MKPGDIVPQDQIYSDPPLSRDESLIQFYGMPCDEENYRLYSVPADRSVGEIVREFEVGSHGADSYGYDVAETVELVALTAIKITEIAPCRVIFADAAGLKLRFDRKVTDRDIQRMEELFPEEAMMQMGLERYMSEWDGESSILSPVLDENMFHLWWD